MNRNDFLNMIEDTVPVNRQMIGEVYELIDIFLISRVPIYFS